MQTSALGGLKVLLTGATGGIGQSIVSALLNEGCSIAAQGRSLEKLEAFGDSGEGGKVKGHGTLKGHGILKGFKAELSNSQDCVNLVKDAVDWLTGLDLIINNAGYAVNKGIEDTDTDLWNALMDVNARAPFIISRESLKYLKKSKRNPKIINVSSVVATKGYVNQAVYTASKHALKGFSKVLAKEVHPHGITVHLIAPGGVATPMVSKMRPDIDTSDLIRPRFIAETILYLLKTDGSGFIDEINIRRAGKVPWE